MSSEASDTSDRAAFLRAVCEDPSDDCPRLVFADWLDENGEPDRAEFIRVQCELAARPKEAGRWGRLNARQEELLRRHERAWRAEVPDWVPRTSVFRRGFIDSLACTADEFVTRAESLESVPLLNLHLWHAGSRIKQVLECPLLARVHKLSLSNNTLSDVAAEAIASSPYLARATWLDLGYNQVTDAGAAALSASPYLSNLTECCLNHNAISPTGAESLLASPRLPKLRWLLLVNNPIPEPDRQRLRARYAPVVSV